MCVCVCSGVGRFKKFSVNQVTFSTFWKPSPIIRSRCTHTQARTRAALSGGAAGGGSGGSGPGPCAEPPRPRKRHGGLGTRWGVAAAPGAPRPRRRAGGAAGARSRARPPGVGSAGAVSAQGGCGGYISLSAPPAGGRTHRSAQRNPKARSTSPKPGKNKKPRRQKQLEV